MSALKPTRPAYDLRMSVHWGLPRAPGGKPPLLLGVRIGDKLAWPHAQVDKDDVVEVCPPRINYLAINRDRPASEWVSGSDAEIMSSMRADVIDEPELFGGDNSGGGVHGLMQWLPGDENQNPPSFIDRLCGYISGKGPGYRGFASVFMTGARKRDVVADVLGNVTSYSSSSIPFEGKGFKFSVNDPRQPSASFRTFYIPDAPPLSRWCDSVASSVDARMIAQRNVLVMPGEKDHPRRNEDDDLLPAGGGFPRANPAAVLYNIFATEVFKHDVDESLIDANSFILGARIFSKEGLGISLIMNPGRDVQGILQEIYEHAACVVTRNNRTGKFELRVLRPDSVFDDLYGYDASTRPELTGFVATADNMEITSEIQTAAASEAVTSLEVQYTIDETEETDTLTIVNMLATAQLGSGKTHTVDFRMFRDSAAALTAGKRELNVLSRPALTFSADMSREASGLVAYDIIHINMPSEPSIHGRRMRVMSVNHNSGNNGWIQVELMDDIFSLKDVVVTATVPQGPRRGSGRPTIDQFYYTPVSFPMLAASGVPMSSIEEMDDDEMVRTALLASSSRALSMIEEFKWQYTGTVPDRSQMVYATPRATLTASLPTEFVSTLNVYELDFGAGAKDISPGDRLIFVRKMTQKVDNMQFFHSVNSRNVSGFTGERRYGDAQDPTTSPWGVGAAALALDPESETNADGRGLAPYYREEVAYVTSIDRETGVATLRRGVHDTVPVMIPAGSHIYHIPAGTAMPVGFEELHNVKYRSALLGVDGGSSSRGRIDGGLHDAFGRQKCPLRPGDTKIQSMGQTAKLGEKITLSTASDIVVTWANRNRRLDDADPRAWDSGNITKEDNTFAYVRLWRRIRARTPGSAMCSPANLVKTYTNITGNSFTVPVGDILMNMADPTAMIGGQQTGDWTYATDIVGGASYAVEVGFHRGSLPDASSSAPASFQNALLLFDVAVAAGGYGIDYGNDFGGE